MEKTQRDFLWGRGSRFFREETSSNKLGYCLSREAKWRARSEEVGYSQ